MGHGRNRGGTLDVIAEGMSRNVECAEDFSPDGGDGRGGREVDMAEEVSVTAGVPRGVGASIACGTTSAAVQIRAGVSDVMGVVDSAQLNDSSHALSRSLQHINGLACFLLQGYRDSNRTMRVPSAVWRDIAAALASDGSADGAVVALFDELIVSDGG